MEGGSESVRGTFSAHNQRLVWEDGTFWNKLPFTGQYNASTYGGCPRYVRFETESSAKIFGGKQASSSKLSEMLMLTR